MAMQFRNVSAEPVTAGQRIGGRLLQGLVISAGYLLFMLYTAAMVASGNYYFDTTAPTVLMLLYTFGMTIWQLVLIFTRSCTIGGRLLGYKFLRTDTGEDARATVFLKYLVQGFFEGATFGIGTITLLVSYRDGQHWLDRTFNVVAVRTGSVRVAAAAPSARPETPAGPRVMPVQMPQRPTQGAPAGTAGRPGNSYADLPAMPVSSLAPAPSRTAAPPAAPRSPIDAPAVPAPGGPQPSGSPFAPSNPWALPPDQAAPATAGPAAPSFAPPGQAPLAPAVTATPPRPAPSASVLHDETVIDPEVTSGTVPAVVLDDGQRITLEGPVVLGRNPSGPEAYPLARAVQVVDESMRLSKTHVVVLPVEGGVAVFDVGATNGVHLEVDGTKARLSANEVHLLPAGATVHFGGRKLRVDA